MLQTRDFWLCIAAKNAVIHTMRSETNPANSHITGLYRQSSQRLRRLVAAFVDFLPAILVNQVFDVPRWNAIILDETQTFSHGAT
jgi:hypothetical protein